jgi:surfactin synthase thioesterase subunit
VLCCFPHAGGSASFYQPLSAALAPGIEVLAVQYPGRQDRRAEPLIDDIGTLADALARVLADTLTPDTAFFGHSMGAIVAFEVALRLERAGMPVQALIASGRHAPSWPRAGNVHLRGDDALIREMRELSGTHSALLADEEVLGFILPVLRSDYRAIETYGRRDDAVLSCPVTVFTGDADSRVTPSDARAWERHTEGGFSMRTFSGGHFYLSDRVREVSDALREVLFAIPCSGRDGSPCA